MNSSAIRYLALALLPTITLAQPTVQWEDLHKAAEKAVKDDRAAEFVILTASGRSVSARNLSFSADSVSDSSIDQPLERADIAEIRVRHRGSLNYFRSHPICGDSDDLVLCILPAWAVPLVLANVLCRLAATPPMAAVEAIRRVGPAKVLYKAAP